MRLLALLPYMWKTNISHTSCIRLPGGLRRLSNDYPEVLQYNLKAKREAVEFSITGGKTLDQHLKH